MTTAPVRPLHAPPALQPSSKASFFQSPPLELESPFSVLGPGSPEGPRSSQPPSYSWIRPPRGQRGRTRKRLGVNRSDLQTHKLSLSKEPPKPTPSSLLPRLEGGAPSLPEEANHPQARLKTPVLRQSGPGQCGGRGQGGMCWRLSQQSCSALQPEAHLRQSSGELPRTPGEGASLNIGR